MLDYLHDVFGWVCGQSQAHTWSPGDVTLPCCQRCTGVYVGAFVAALFHLSSMVSNVLTRSDFIIHLSFFHCRFVKQTTSHPPPNKLPHLSPVFSLFHVWVNNQAAGCL